MSSGLSESKWLYGIHDPGGEYLMLRNGKAGWVVFLHCIGHDPNDNGGVDFRRFRMHHLGVISTLCSDASPVHSVPIAVKYGDFAQRCANFVRSSRGCSIWVIGNEPNVAIERPIKGMITPRLYAECYRRCRDAIRGVPGHADDQVLVAAIAPWNSDTQYSGNEWGDWVVYFEDVVNHLGAGGCDGFAMHTSTHQPDPRLITSSATLNAPFVGRHLEFRAYRDFLSVIPGSMKHLPVYITQTHQGDEWRDSNDGWVQAAYDEIDEWNRMPGTQRIHAMALFRWSGTDSLSLQSKNGIVHDFRDAMAHRHQWQDIVPPPWTKGTRLLTLTTIELREAPIENGISDINAVDLIPPYAQLIVERRAAVPANGRIWWYVRELEYALSAREGWIAQDTLSGERQLRMLDGDNYSESGTANSLNKLQPGGYAKTLDIVRMRHTPGYQDKPFSDIVTDVPFEMTLPVLAGPRVVDGLRWWLVRLHASSTEQYTGWMAETSPTGQKLLIATEKDSDGDGSGDDDKNTDHHLFVPGDLAETLTWVRLRRSPGYVDKPDSDVLADISQGAAVAIMRGPASADELVWWWVSTVSTDGTHVEGWMADHSPDGVPLLAKRVAVAPPNYDVGDLAIIQRIPVRIRTTPGYVDKDDYDVIGEFAPSTTVVVQSEKDAKDDLVWWRAGGISRYGEAIGWIAQDTPGGVRLVGGADPLPGTHIPDATIGAYLGAPYAGLYGIGQLWGENGWYYRRYAYEGVRLLGHNGIDFLLPTGNPVYATESGSVVTFAYEDAGLGWYVLLAHAWGESIYAHLKEVSVASGQYIGRGEPLGVSGNSGASTGPHLHFAIRILPYNRADGWGGFSDPLPYLNPDTFLLPNYILDEELQIRRAGMRSVFPRLEPSGMADDQDGLDRP